MAILTAARGWIGTPFHHQGRVKGVGCDCIGLIVGVAAELGLPSRLGGLLVAFDARDYAREPDGRSLGEVLARHFYPACGESPVSGDVALFRIGGLPAHVGILAEERGGWRLIHAYAPARKVVEHAFDARWQARLVARFHWCQSL